MERLNATLGHWPVVCSECRQKHGLPRQGNRHETRQKCSNCNVHLCVDKERNCYCKYHTLVDNFFGKIYN